MKRISVRWLLAASTCSMLVLAGCAAIQMHNDGMRLVSEGNYEAGLPLLREASRKDPSSSEYRIDLIRETGAYARNVLERADDAKRNGNIAEATAG